MKYKTIKCPRWTDITGKRRDCFGISVRDHADDDIIVRCPYRDKDGNKLHPHYYGMKRERLITYPIQKGDGHRPDCFIVPVVDFTVKEDPNYVPVRVKTPKIESKPKVEKNKQLNLFI